MWQRKRVTTREAPLRGVPRDGRVWICVGVNLGYEATTALYITDVSLLLTPFPDRQRTNHGNAG
ncbi:MAG TPA: hypothetical protein VFH51_14330 [Myxococcota bacterium]|nr:hypothetical protein [Myxococcota bacterium]